ncbi:MAG: hypothetical protein ACMUIA_08160 [bacterium]
MKTDKRLGSYYKGSNFTGENITCDDMTYVNPSTFINDHCKVPITGDWNADGEDAIGTYRMDLAHFCIDDAKIDYGNVSDIPIAGDWNGDGKDDIGVFRKYYSHEEGHTAFYWRINSGHNSIEFPPIEFGNKESIPVTGDWNGNGYDTIGVFDPLKGKFVLDFNHNGIANKSLFLRAQGSTPIAGDWDGDGDDDIGIFKIDEDEEAGTFYLDMDLTGRLVEYTVSVPLEERKDKSFNIPLVGDWDGDGDDDVGLYVSPARKIFIDISMDKMIDEPQQHKGKG